MSNIPYGGDEISALVFEFGSYTSKIGHSGEDCPRVTFPTWVGRHDSPENPVIVPEGPNKDDDGSTDRCTNGVRYKRKKPYKIGETEISFWQEGLDLRNPLKECLGNYVEDWDLFEALVEYSFASLSVDPKEHPVLLCEPSWNTQALRDKSMELFFEKFELPTFYISSNGVLTSFASGKSSALVFECAHEFMSATPVVDGFVLKRNIHKQPYAGKYLSRKVRELFEKDNIKITPQYLVRSKRAVDAGIPAKAVLRSREKITESFHEFGVEVVEREIAEFKASILQVPEMPLAENRQFAYATSTKNYELPDGYNNVFGIERLSIPEKLFCNEYNPRSTNNDPQSQSRERDPGTANNVQNNVDECSDLIPASLLIQASINSCDADLVARLYPNIVVSGGSTLIPGFTERLNYDLTNLTAGMKMRIHSPRLSIERLFSSWIGGSIISSLGTFHQLWISREEYLEHGSNYDRRIV